MNKFRFGKYRESDAMSNLISENYPALLVMSRFGIALGFGEKSIGEVCRNNQVDTNTFLAIINLMVSENRIIQASDTKISVESLINYLHNSHNYFLNYRLPEIREKLSKVLNPGEDDLNKAVLEYFDKFVAEVKKHMLNEDKKVFPYVKSLLRAGSKDKYNIGFSKQHEQIETRLTEFKNILIKYYPAQSTNKMNGVLFDIFNCEKDLASHNAVEEYLFLPAIVELEGKTEKLS
ncbi:cation-binding protein [Bacteroidia bacterium]|nr:cation-binding protein [Bacteroidia bacterium]GHU81559.1 cation-binding protein [Bacteroidia bacterium]GHV70649.1 cation-binding protein [Bacteroidia bacterium]